MKNSNKVGRSVALSLLGEESPDRVGHLAAESADGSNLMYAVAENNCPLEGWTSTSEGENVR